jgi:hypothetical protein
MKDIRAYYTGKTGTIPQDLLLPTSFIAVEAEKRVVPYEQDQSSFISKSHDTGGSFRTRKRPSTQGFITQSIHTSIRPYSLESSLPRTKSLDEKTSLD